MMNREFTKAARGSMADKVAKSKGGGILIPALLITIIALGGGAGFGWFMLGKTGVGDISTKTASKPVAKKKGKKGKKGKGDKKGKNASSKDEVSRSEEIISLPAITTNLNSISKRWVRLEASIIAKSGTEAIAEKTQSRLTQDIMTHLRELKLEDLEGVAGLANLRSDLREIVRIRTKGRSEEVIVHGIIVE